jgi:hypothetical protein
VTCEITPIYTTREREVGMGEMGRWRNIKNSYHPIIIANSSFSFPFGHKGPMPILVYFS